MGGVQREKEGEGLVCRREGEGPGCRREKEVEGPGAPTPGAKAWSGSAGSERHASERSRKPSAPGGAGAARASIGM
jgi:hypothetical protein